MPGGNIAMAYFTPHLLPELEFDTDTGQPPFAPHLLIENCFIRFQ
jgi:hypothetical protein